jgi:fumarylacetoacetate (FAA) hydrolase
MKLVTFHSAQGNEVGLYHQGAIYPLARIDNSLPQDMGNFLRNWDRNADHAREILNAIDTGKYAELSIPYDESLLRAPVPNPTSCRDGYAFRQHVEAARRNRGVPMIPEFDQYPIFYFTNHNAVQGPGEIRCMPDHFEKLDFELEAAVVLGKKGRNIKAEDADDYIAGYMVMNDMSARRLQMEEMLLNLGPAKGKDFTTVIGPWLVTPDELEAYRTSPKPGHTGRSYQLAMRGFVNGIQVSEGSVADMDWTFAEIIERCAYGADVFPGDVIGSGTVGTGCFLELNGTGKLNNPDYQEQWLQEGDVVEMEIEGLGRLRNTIRREETDFSLLRRKKNIG